MQIPWLGCGEIIGVLADETKEQGMFACFRGEEAVRDGHVACECVFCWANPLLFGLKRKQRNTNILGGLKNADTIWSSGWGNL